MSSFFKVINLFPSLCRSDNLFGNEVLIEFSLAYIYFSQFLTHRKCDAMAYITWQSINTFNEKFKS